jgi:predicted phage-related endonuclease
MTTAFDTLAYTQKLRSAGIANEQAEAHAEALKAALAETVATKQDVDAVRRDLKEVETALRTELKNVETAVRTELKNVETAVRAELKDVETAVRAELKDVETALRADLKDMETALRHDLQATDTALRHEMTLLRRDMEEMERRITFKLGGIVAAVGAAIVVLDKLL